MAQRLRAPTALSESQISFQHPQQQLMTAGNSSSRAPRLPEESSSTSTQCISTQTQTHHKYRFSSKEKRERLFLTLFR